MSFTIQMNPKKKKAVLITYWWCWNPAKTSWDPPCNQFRGRPSHFQEITTAWLGLTIPTPSGKQCQGRGWVDDRDILYLYYISGFPWLHENRKLKSSTAYSITPLLIKTPLPHTFYITYFLRISMRTMAQYAIKMNVAQLNTSHENGGLLKGCLKQRFINQFL